MLWTNAFDLIAFFELQMEFQLLYVFVRIQKHVISKVHCQMKDKFNQALLEGISESKYGLVLTSNREFETAQWNEKDTWRLSRRHTVALYEPGSQHGPQNNSTLWSTSCEKTRQTEAITAHLQINIQVTTESVSGQVYIENRWEKKRVLVWVGKVRIKCGQKWPSSIKTL